MKVAPCRPYHAVLEDRRLVHMPDGRSAYKIYYISIIGRTEPQRYEWKKSGFSFEAFEEGVRRSGLEGVGFITAFPHITKVFRFAPEMETVLYVKAYDTASWTSLDLFRPEGWMEFACLAESAVAADEHLAWGRAASVSDYLALWSEHKEWGIVDHRKLSAFWESRQEEKGKGERFEKSKNFMSLVDRDFRP